MEISNYKFISTLVGGNLMLFISNALPKHKHFGEETNTNTSYHWMILDFVVILKLCSCLMFSALSKCMAHLECWVWQKSSWRAELTPGIHTCRYPGPADILSEKEKCLYFIESSSVSFILDFVTHRTEETIKCFLFKL